jgi:GNAT superfamily N-acetyltransferase
MVSQPIDNKTSMINQKISILRRPSEKSDINSLVKICKECFPENVLWNTEFLSRRFWNMAVGSNSNEIWVWQINGEIAAFSQNITDLVSWSQEKIKFNQYSSATKILMLLLKPNLLYHKLKLKLWMIHYFREQNGRNGDSKTPRQLHHSKGGEEFRNSQTQIYYGGIYADPQRLLWIDYVAILPKFRNYSLTFQIIKFNEERALSLGRKEIYGVIHARIKVWWTLHERLGYQRINEESGRYTYGKMLK